MLTLIININGFAFQSFLGLWCVELQIRSYHWEVEAGVSL